MPRPLTFWYDLDQQALTLFLDGREYASIALAELAPDLRVMAALRGLNQKLTDASAGKNFSGLQKAEAWEAEANRLVAEKTWHKGGLL